MDADADYPPFRGTDINISHQFGGKLRNNLLTEKSAGGIWEDFLEVLRFLMALAA